MAYRGVQDYFLGRLEDALGDWTSRRSGTLCLQDDPGPKQVERHNTPEVEVQTTPHVCLRPVREGGTGPGESREACGWGAKLCPTLHQILGCLSL